jgi:putative ABC transport system permease protein
MVHVLQDLRHAARRLRRSAAFSAASVLTLGLAIGANVAIFAVVERVVLNPLPYPASDRLINLDHGALKLHFPSGMGLTPGLYLQYAERARTLDGAAVYHSENLTLTGDGEPERIRVTHTTPSLEHVLRVAPALGRWFTADEGVPGGPPAVVLSQALWDRRYGGSPAVLGRQIVLGGAQMTVVGVMPAAFAFPDPLVEAWLSEPLARSMGFGFWNYGGVARLRGAATLEDARAEMKSLIADVPEAYPGDPIARGNIEINLVVTSQTLKEATIGGIARSLWILLAAVGLVLLVACANVANLFLVRSESRQREIAVRRALGAGRSEIARFFLSESLLLSAVGGAVGFALASAGVRLLVALGPATLPRLAEIRLDRVAAGFAVGLAVVTAFLFGAIPLLHGSPLAATLHESGRGATVGRGRHRVRRLLMAGQVALALVLLVSSGLLARSFQRLRAVDPGFDASSALTFSIGLPDRSYRSVPAVVAAHRAIVDRLRALPGVTAVSTTTCLPLSGGCHGNTVRVQGQALPEGAIPPVVMFRAIDGDYFQTMGIRLVRGRVIDRADVDRREPIVVVDQRFASRLFPDQDPLGQHVASNRPGELTWLTVVGVVANTPVRALGEAEPLPALYMPMSIAAGPGVPAATLVGPDVSAMNYVVRTTTPPLGLLRLVRGAIDSVDRNLAFAQVRTLQDQLDRASAQAAFTMALIAIAAAVALLLGVIGIYGVMSYIVSQRTGEIGVRLALGAEPGVVARRIVSEGGIVALGGIVAGLAAAFAGSRLLESLLYGIGPRDPAVFTVTTLVLLAVALAACWVPAHRASRLSPLDALRSE